MPNPSQRTKGPWIVVAFVLGLIGMLTLAYVSLQNAKDIGGDNAKPKPAKEAPAD